MFFFCFFDILLTVCLSILISVINQLDVQNFCFTIILFHASTCFEHYALIIRRSRLHYTAFCYRHAGTSERSKITKIRFYKYEQNSSKIYVWIFRVWLLCITYCKHVVSCRGYVYPVIKLIRKVLCLFTFLLYMYRKFIYLLYTTATCFGPIFWPPQSYIQGPPVNRAIWQRHFSILAWAGEGEWCCQVAWPWIAFSLKWSCGPVHSALSP